MAQLRFGLIAFWPNCVLAKNTKPIQATGLKRVIDGNLKSCKVSIFPPFSTTA